MGGVRAEPAKIPSTTLAEGAREALRTLLRVIRQDGNVHVRVQPEGEQAEVTITLPREALELFVEVLGYVASGNEVTIISQRAELTTRQAAELLNVSRPYLVGLLEAGKIPFRMVGTHRRIRFTDVMAYRQKDDARRDEVLAELTRQAEDLGLGY